MRQPGLEAFVEAIEAHLGALRGSVHTLSPRDFAVARGWFEAGVALAAALAEIDRVAEQGPVVSLAACRDRLEATAPRQRPAPAERAPLPVSVALADTVHALQRLRTALAARADAGRLPRRVDEVLDLLSVATRPNAPHLREELARIDDEVGALALRWAGPEREAAFRDEARRSLARQRGKVREEALEAALRRHVEQRAREELGLPRVAQL